MPVFYFVLNQWFVLFLRGWLYIELVIFTILSVTYSQLYTVR
ncbi:hypothetical protein P20311_3416 [Pseudoalteromonas sp. BSi20311]|nr:hypothetical protein P20311_3416 [Pseudoalteromonas sp. BSi20311]GAA71653.1 hypothetical protein P20439_1729 [Pseudoalteromonas sp. BSi20439]